MRRTGTKTASVNNLTVDTAGLQSLLSAGYPTAVEIGTAAGASLMERVEDPEVSGRDFRVRGD